MATNDLVEINIEINMDRTEGDANVENQSPNVQQADNVTAEQTLASVELFKAPAKVSAAAPKSMKKKRSISNRAGVIFPVTRIRQNLKNTTTKKLRIQVGSAVYLAGVLEYLVAEIMELTGTIAKLAKKVRITPRHLLLAIKQDDELDKLLKNATIASGGVLKTVHPALLPKNSRSKKIDTSE